MIKEFNHSIMHLEILDSAVVDSNNSSSRSGDKKKDVDSGTSSGSSSHKKSEVAPISASAPSKLTKVLFSRLYLVSCYYSCLSRSRLR